MMEKLKVILEDFNFIWEVESLFIETKVAGAVD